MADAPSLRISTRSIADSGIALTSTDTLSLVNPYPYGDTRRPLISTSVRGVPRARNDTPDSPRVVAPDVDAAVMLLELAIAEMVCINCSTLETPARSMSLRVIV